MNSRSESRLRYCAVSGFVALGVVVQQRPHGPLGAAGDRPRHVQVRGAGGAAGQDERVELRQALVEAVAPALESGDVLLVTRSGGYFGSLEMGLHRSAPTSNRSFCTWRSGASTSSARPPTVTATPIAALHSSVSA